MSNLVKIKFVKDYILWNSGRFIKFLSDEVYTVEDRQDHWVYRNIKIPSHEAIIVNYDKPTFAPISNSIVKPISFPFYKLRRKIREVRESHKSNIDIIKLDYMYDTLKTCLWVDEYLNEIEMPIFNFIETLEEEPHGLILMVCHTTMTFTAIKDVNVIVENNFIKLGFVLDDG